MALVSDKLSGDIGILQAKLSDREGYKARCVGAEAMPLDEHVEDGHGAREPGMKIRPDPVHDFLEVADERQHREHRFHQDAVAPLPALTEFEVRRIAFRGMEARVTQDNHVLLKRPNQPLKRVIRDIGSGTVPRDNQAILVQQ